MAYEYKFTSVLHRGSSKEKFRVVIYFKYSELTS